MKPGPAPALGPSPDSPIAVSQRRSSARSPNPPRAHQRLRPTRPTRPQARARARRRVRSRLSDRRRRRRCRRSSAGPARAASSRPLQVGPYAPSPSRPKTRCAHSRPASLWNGPIWVRRDPSRRPSSRDSRQRKHFRLGGRAPSPLHRLCAPFPSDCSRLWFSGSSRLSATLSHVCNR